MKTVELFSGTKSFSKVAYMKGHQIFTIDNNEDLKPDSCIDLLHEWNSFGFTYYIDFMWCSPPCTAFSVASIGKNWDKETRLPKSEKAEVGLKLLENTIRMIKKFKPKYWVIENPRGMMRKVIDDLFKKHDITNYNRQTVTYCQYGDTRMKPTDLWMNFDWKTKPMCKNGDSCHESAPRGSRTGTQGLKGNKERSVIPPALFEELFEQIEKLGGRF